MNAILLHPNEWTTLPGTERVHICMVDGRDFVLTRRAGAAWDLWACPYLLLVKVGQLGWPWPLTPLPLRR